MFIKFTRQYLAYREGAVAEIIFPIRALQLIHLGVAVQCDGPVPPPATMTQRTIMATKGAVETATKVIVSPFKRQAQKPAVGLPENEGGLFIPGAPGGPRSWGEV